MCSCRNVEGLITEPYLDRESVACFPSAFEAATTTCFLFLSNNFDRAFFVGAVLEADVFLQQEAGWLLRKTSPTMTQHQPRSHRTHTWQCLLADNNSLGYKSRPTSIAILTAGSPKTIEEPPPGGLEILRLDRLFAGSVVCEPKMSEPCISCSLRLDMRCGVDSFSSTLKMLDL
jgi:hypothetical protein